MKKLIKWLGIALGAAVLAAAAGLAVLTAAEYRPAQEESVAVEGKSGETLTAERGAEGIRILTFNIGYGGLGAEQDFFMDGGQKVRPESEEVVKGYLDGIGDILLEQQADVLFLQEVDRKAKRTYKVNEAEYLWKACGSDEPDGYAAAMTAAYAKNFDAVYVPYPFPETMGQVEAGLMTWNRFRVEEAARISLPTSYTWPIRTCQLKRCLLVERLPIEGSDKELVLINLHLEAYDDGSGKAAQTAVLMELLAEEYAKGNYCIAGGDFNQTFETTDTSAYPLVDASYFEAGIIEEDLLPDGISFQADPSNPTARLLNMPYDPSDPMTQYYVIDDFLVSDNVEVQAVETLDERFVYSDHNPVLLTVTLEP